MLITRELVPGGRSDIVAVDPESGKSKRLVRSAKEGRWSPDGSSILFLSDRDKTGEQCYEGGCEFQVKLYTAKSDGSDQRRVQSKQQAGTILGADWSPDGSRIAFGSDRNMPGIFGISMELYSIRPDGSCLTWLTNGSPESWDPNWSPVSGFDSNPGSCGAVEREVVVDPLPSPHPLVDDKPAAWTRLWPGPVHQGRVLTLPFAEGDELLYFDCTSFRRSDCRFIYIALESRDICDRGVSDFLEASRYRGVVEHRGALLSRPLYDKSGNRQVTLITGGQTVTVLLENFHSKKPASFAEYLELVDELRPVGRDDLVDTELQGAVFDRGDIEKAAGIAKSFDRFKSVPKVAERFRTKSDVVRAYLRFQRDLDELGPVKTTRCPV